MEISLSSDLEPDEEGGAWPLLPLGEKATAGSRACNKEHLTAFFSLFFFFPSVLKQFTQLALVGVMHKEYGVCC